MGAPPTKVPTVQRCIETLQALRDDRLRIFRKPLALHLAAFSFGEQLTRALIGEGARRGLGLCLSMRSEDPARRLYERLGFRDIPSSAVTNRNGGMSIGIPLGWWPPASKC